MGARPQPSSPRPEQKCAIGDLDVELADKAAINIGNATGTQVVGLSLDVTQQPSFEQFVNDAEAALGPIDVLINNAGIMPTGLFLDEEPWATDRIIDTNLRGVITGSRLAARRFADRGSGVIINVASLAGVTGIPGLATYCATKHAVIGFSEALAAGDAQSRRCRHRRPARGGSHRAIRRRVLAEVDATRRHRRTRGCS